MRFYLPIDMRIFHILHCLVAQWFYRWAMREINPTHRDVPYITHRQHALAEKWKRVGWK